MHLWEGAEPPEGMGPAGTLWAGSPHPAPCGVIPLCAEKGSEPKALGHSLTLPCATHLLEQQGETARLCSLQGMGGSRRDG